MWLCFFAALTPTVDRCLMCLEHAANLMIPSQSGTHVESGFVREGAV